MNKTEEVKFQNMRARILELEERNEKLWAEGERLREALGIHGRELHGKEP